MPPPMPLMPGLCLGLVPSPCLLPYVTFTFLLPAYAYLPSYRLHILTTWVAHTHIWDSLHTPSLSPPSHPLHHAHVPAIPGLDTHCCIVVVPCTFYHRFPLAATASPFAIPAAHGGVHPSLQPTAMPHTLTLPFTHLFTHIPHYTAHTHLSEHLNATIRRQRGCTATAQTR